MKAVGLNVAFMLFYSFGAFAQAGSNTSSEIQALFNEEIKPILNVVLGIAVLIAAVVTAFQFFNGKKEAFKSLAYIVVGALVVRFLPDIVISIIEN